MRRKIPSTQSLACFEAAARHESYTRAAQELALTQSAVSRQIGALEEFMGLALFRRTRHGVQLTAAGADYARQISRQLDAMERDTLDAMARQGSGGALQLAAVPTFATRWLIPRLPAFAQEHPDVTVHIETRTRPFLFADSPFDAALYAGTAEQAANWAGTRSTVLMHEDVVPVCSPALIAPKRQLTPAAVARLPLLQQRLNTQSQRLRQAIVRMLEHERQTLQQASRTLHAVSPLATLERGYAILFDAEGKVLRSVLGVESGAALRARLVDGELAVRVEKREPPKASS